VPNIEGNTTSTSSELFLITYDAQNNTKKNE